ncbi:hypothetical protein ES703_57800 [subsurface metagenome]
MGVIYQLTFFLALGLLAIVVTIFVFAVSLLGRAMESARESEKEKTKERRTNNAKEMAAIKKEIEEAEGQIPKGLTRKLEKLEKRDKKFGKELNEIRTAPELLTVKGGVVPSSASLLGALIVTGAAWYLSNIQIFTWIVPVLIWILGLVAIGYSISRIYQSLKVIESVAITSEEAALLRETEALKIAFGELEEEKKPKLELLFGDEQPPFHIESGAQMTIEFRLGLTQGDIARKPIVYFFAPPGFDFPGMRTWLQSKDVGKVGGYITTRDELNDCREGITQSSKITVKAPSDKGSFNLWYRANCEGFPGEMETVEIIVG